ncbi:MAG: tRNA-intron lyase [Candidatus Thermoplasmatota archaeon]
MPIHGILKNTNVLVTNPNDIGRLYQRSCFGVMDSSSQLKLDLLEALFLLGEKKIQIYQQNQAVSFDELISYAFRFIPDIETQYLIFKDLRSRGLMIRPDPTHQYHLLYQSTQNKKNIKAYISVFSERDSFQIATTQRQCTEAEKKHTELWYGIVDEEGDITYYTISKINPTGEITEQHYKKTQGILLTNRVLLFDQKAARDLHHQEFYGKPFESGLQLSLIEAIYLHHRGILDIQTEQQKNISSKHLMKQFAMLQPDLHLRLPVFIDLKQRGLIVKTGFKFGTHFRAYTKRPDATHAEYLIVVVQNQFESNLSDISRAVRLAHSVHKEILFAVVQQDTIEYIKFGRLRP